MWIRKLWAVPLLAACACGGENTRPDRDGGTSGTGNAGGTGGTGGQAGAAGAAGQAGTGGGGSGGSASVDLPNCYALCAWEVSVSGDCPADANEQCQAAFRVLTIDKDEACLGVVETWCQCLLDNTDPSVVSCTGGPVTSNIPVINGSPAACDAETNAWVQCNQ